MWRSGQHSITLSIETLTVVDAVPIGTTLERCDAAFASACWHWLFLGQTNKPAEALISANPDAWYRPDRKSMGEENYQD